MKTAIAPNSPPHSSAGALEFPLPPCNAHPARYWAITSRQEHDALRLAAEIDTQWMFAVVTLHGDGTASFAISRRTWERQEGHYPLVYTVVKTLAQSPLLRGVRGSFIAWLEDGMWESCRAFSQRVPILAFGRSKGDPYTALIPDPAFFGSEAYRSESARAERYRRDMPWHKRTPTIFWRGAATGPGIEGERWRSCARGALTLRASEIGDLSIVDARLTRLKHLPSDAIERFVAMGLVGDEIPLEEYSRYRYLVDADGYHCAWASLFQKLLSGSVVLKMESPAEQWYHNLLEPWVHYVPLARDASDLREVHAWLTAHDQEAQKIAERGAALARSLTLERSVDEVIATLRGLLGAPETI